VVLASRGRASAVARRCWRAEAEHGQRGGEPGPSWAVAAPRPSLGSGASSRGRAWATGRQAEAELGSGGAEAELGQQGIEPRPSLGCGAAARRSGGGAAASWAVAAASWAVAASSPTRLGRAAARRS
jgi:hypothetical protein